LPAAARRERVDARAETLTVRGASSSSAQARARGAAHAHGREVPPAGPQALRPVVIVTERDQRATDVVGVALESEPSIVTHFNQRATIRRPPGSGVGNDGAPAAGGWKTRTVPSVSCRQPFARS
jgi:hypothetical protein